MAINPSIAAAIKNSNVTIVSPTGMNRHMFFAIMVDTTVYYWNRDTRLPRIWELDSTYVSSSPHVAGRLHISPWDVKDHGKLISTNSDDLTALTNCRRKLISRK